METLELTSDAVMTRDLSPLSLVRGLECLQVTSFNDPVSYAIHPAILTLTSLRELSLRALSLELVQVRPQTCSAQPGCCRKSSFQPGTSPHGCQSRQTSCLQYGRRSFLQSRLSDAGHCNDFSRADASLKDASLSLAVQQCLFLRAAQERLTCETEARCCMAEGTEKAEEWVVVCPQQPNSGGLIL